MRSILESSAYSRNVTYAAIVNVDGVAIAHSDASNIGRTLDAQGDLNDVLKQGPVAQWRAIYSDQGRNLEIGQPLLMGNTEFGSIRIGVSTLLIRGDLDQALRPAALTALAALIVASLGAMLLARLFLRPIQLIRGGLTRLKEGEFGVQLNLSRQDEFGELGDFFDTVSAQLSVDRSQLAGQKAALLAAIGRLTSGVAHEVKNPLNAMMIHLELLRQRLSRRSRAVAGGPPTGAFDLADEDQAAAQEHVSVIASEIRRLDNVVQGFLKFTRPPDLNLEALTVMSLLDEIRPVVEAEAQKNLVQLEFNCPNDLPAIRGDAGMLQQAFLNLALNACQAMPDGGTLRVTGRAARGQRVEIVFEDTGVGISPEHLERIFELYFSTKEQGSGIGLSMVYRIVQMHDGEIEVQSSRGHGTAFHMLLLRPDVNSILARALFLILVLATAGGCSRLQARTEPVRPALETPPPPPHLIISVGIELPAEVEPLAAMPAPVEELPAPPPVRATPRAAPKVEAAPAQPVAEPEVPRRTLQTTTNVGETELKIRAQMAQAAQDLGRINYRALSAEGRAQYDIAKRFNQQAEEAENEESALCRAAADKAASLAALLLNL